MSDRELGKKMVEEESLSRFLYAYEKATGQRLAIVARSERPDFICRRPSSEEVGVEITSPAHDFDRKAWDRLNAPERGKSDDDLLSDIFQVIEQKQLKIQSGQWSLLASTILVVELKDYEFSSLDWLADIDDDCAVNGFREIWLADCSTLEPYGIVRLIGLYPAEYRGDHFDDSSAGKPFG